MIEDRNITWHAHRVSREDRSKKNGHRSVVLWLTGLPSSGKSTIANELDWQLHRLGVHSYVLDGDNIRHGLNKDLGFSTEDRNENIRRIGEVAKLFADAGVIAITAFVSPFIKDREAVRKLLGVGEFIEVFVKCPVRICADRDPKGLYKKAFSGEIKEFTGVSHPYEDPPSAEIVLDTDQISVDGCVARVIDYLKTRQIVE